MDGTSFLHQACCELFANYPLAVRTASHVQSVRSMLLALREGDTSAFFIVSRDSRDGRDRYSVRRWRTPGVTSVEVGEDGIPDAAVNAVMNGVPVPRHGSLFGWKAGRAITSLLVVYTRYTPEYQQPSWLVLPKAGTSEGRWPPFADERFFGRWFWEFYWAGTIVDLGHLVASVSDMVFWVDTRAAHGSRCCIVRQDVNSPEGYTLPHGRYVYYQALREDRPVPSLEALLTDPSRTDLSDRFQLPAQFR